MLAHQLTQAGREQLRAEVELARFHERPLPPVALWSEGAAYLGPAVDSLHAAREGLRAAALSPPPGPNRDPPGRRGR